MHEASVKIYSAEALNRYLDKLLDRCKKENLEIVKFLNKGDKNLGNELFVHYVFNVYCLAQDKEEKNHLKDLLKKLLDLGADPNAWNKHERSPLLHRAIKIHSVNLVKIITQSKKVNYNQQQHEMYLTPLQLCVENWSENIPLIEYLASRSDFSLQDIFMEALSDQDKKRVTFLIRNQLIDFNQCDSEGRLPIHLLTIQADEKFINFVIQNLEKVSQKIDFNAVDRKGNSALHYACHVASNQKSNIIEWLLKNKADPNRANYQGNYPAHFIVEANDPQLVMLLARNKADFEKLDQHGRTPVAKVLMQPEKMQSAKMLQALFLISSKSSKHRSTKNNMTPIQVAFEHGFWIRGIGVNGKKQKEAIEREVEILQRRENISLRDLDRHDPAFDIEENPAYCFSPATFVKAGIPIMLFESKKFGVIIQTDRKIPAWCSGLKGALLTDGQSDVDFEAKVLQFKYDSNHQLQNSTSVEIGIKLQQLVFQDLQRCSALLRYNYFLDSTTYPFNEGLFRYRKEEIKGFVVSNSPQSVYYAKLFQEKLGLQSLLFFEYESNGKLHELSSVEVNQLAAQYKPKDATPFQFESFKPNKGGKKRKRVHFADEADQNKRVLVENKV